MGKKIYSIIKNLKRIDVSETDLRKQVDEGVDWDSIIQALESMNPQEQEQFKQSLTPEQAQQLDETLGEQGQVDPAEQEAQPSEEEVLEERPDAEQPVEEAVKEPIGEEEVQEQSREEVPVEGELPIDEQPVNEQPIEEQPPVGQEQPVQEAEDVPKPLQVVCPHCKGQVTVPGSDKQNSTNEVPGPLREPEEVQEVEEEGNPY